MANDNKVKKETKDIKALGAKFLPEEISNIDGGVEVYSLEDEFAKTRKNKNWAVVIMILIFVVVMVSITVLFTYYTDVQNKKIDISFNEFDDLRLKEVLSSARMNDNNLMIRKNELHRVIIDMRKEMLDINRRYLVKENAVLDSSAGDAEKRARLGELRSAEKAAIDKVKSAYAKKISRKRANIREIEKEKIAAEKKLKEESVDLSTVGDENKIHALKMKSLANAQKGGLANMTEYYERYIKYLELKYNPYFKSRDLNGAVSKYSRIDPGSFNLREYDSIFSAENIMSKNRFNSLRSK